LLLIAGFLIAGCLLVGMLQRERMPMAARAPS